jgi:hypothetical protein
MSQMINYHSIEYSFTQPYRTHTLLWEAIETNEICIEMDELDDISDTLVAEEMLQNIGVRL